VKIEKIGVKFEVMIVMAMKTDYCLLGCGWIVTDVSEEHVSSIFRVECDGSAFFRWRKHILPKRR
jgi:hypothetical protein